MTDLYDVIIIGGGPAGLAAGLYASRALLNTLIVEQGTPGGLIFTTSEVDNYPGSIIDASGPTLSKRMEEQAKGFGAKITTDRILDIKLKDKIKIVKSEKNEYKAKSVIIAAGAMTRKIGCPGEVEFTGRGVSYCATCDANFFTGLEVFVIGGGDAAVEEAMYLSKFAKKVTIVHRRDELRAAKSIQEKAFKNEKINVRWNSIVAEIKGTDVVDSVVFKDTITGELEEYNASEEDGMMGIFSFIGYVPNTELFKEELLLNEQGYIIANEDMKTNIEGVYAAGDIRVKSLRQVVTSVADGAIAAVQAEKYIENSFE